MITKKEYKYVINLFLKESSYRIYKNEKELIKNFLIDFVKEHIYLLEKNKIYNKRELLRIIKTFHNGISYEKNGNNMRVKNCVNWKTSPYLKANLIFYSYICKKYDFKINKNHFGFKLI